MRWGALITKVIYDEQGAGAFRVFIGLFTMLFFGVFAIAGLVKLLDKRPALEFLNEGLLARDISATPIRWEDIEAARLLTYRQRPVIELMLSPLAEQTLPFYQNGAVYAREQSRAGFSRCLPERGRIGYPAGHTHRDDRRMGAAGSACRHSPSRAAIKKDPALWPGLHISYKG